MRFDVLDRHLNVFEPHFLEASAGTGKTFAIEHLVSRLLLEGESPLLIEQVLVVTFTRAAARELKLRIRNNLSRIKEQLVEKEPAFDYLKAICEAGEAVIKAAIAKIEAALISFDLAQIYTLHGFCHRILREFAFEAGMGMQVADPDEKEHLSLLHSSIRQHLKQGISSPEYSPVQLQAVLKEHKRDAGKMIAKLVDMVSSGKKIAADPHHGQFHDAFLKSLNTLPRVEASRFKADLSLLTPLYKKMTGEEVSVQIEFFAEMLETKCCSLSQFDTLLKEEHFLEKMGPDNVKVRAKFPESSSLHYPGLIEHLRATLLPSLVKARDPSRIFLRLASDLQEKSLPLLESQEKFSPDALLLKVEEALKNPRFAERVREKFRAAIIDEFQDTDPVQWTIFRELFLTHTRAICLVGDPKQSIYAFRNADVYVYLDAADAMGEKAKKYLDTNFRSTKPLVDALNSLFARASKGWMALPEKSSALDVIPVKAGARIAAEDSDPSLEFFIATGKKGRSKQFPTHEMWEGKGFPFIAKEIARLSNEKGVPLHEIAVLVKDRYQGQALIEHLKSCGIPASAKRGALITDSVAFFALREILAAILAPHDMSRVKTALGGPLICFSSAQLCQGFEEGELLEAKSKMHSLSHCFFEKGFGPFFEELLQTTWSRSGAPLLHEIFQRKQLSLYSDLRKLSELIIEEEMRQGLKGEAYLLFLEELSSGDESRLKVAAQEEKGSVTVMTMHMSKGLEFEAVFAIGLASRHRRSEHMVVKREGRALLENFDPEDPASLRATQEIDAEKMRQLYVALTRAKKRLYIPLMIDEEQKEIRLGEGSPIELFFASLMGSNDLYVGAQQLTLSSVCETLGSLAPLIHYRVLEGASPTFFTQAKASLSELIAPPPLSLPTFEERILSFSSLSKSDAPFEVAKPREGAPLSTHTLPMGSETGQLLHRIFEKIFKRGLHSLCSESGIGDLIDEEIAHSPLEKWQPIILPWIIELLKKPLGEFSLSQVAKNSLSQEMEFLFEVETGLMKGFADLFFEFNYRYYVLDWKSNYLGPSDEDYTQEKMAEAMDHHNYRMQASIYTGALKRYVKLFDNRPFSECFGGAIYYFVRGKAAYFFKPETFGEL